MRKRKKRVFETSQSISRAQASFSTVNVFFERGDSVEDEKTSTIPFFKLSLCPSAFGSPRPKTMISLRSSAGVRVAPAVSSSLSSSRAAIAPRSAAPAPLSMMPARVSSSSRRSLKSLAPRAAAGSPPAFGAYGES